MSTALKQEAWDELHDVIDENRDFNEYLLQKGRELPDLWKPREPMHESEVIQTINFTDLPSGMKDYVKAHTYSLFHLQNSGPKTVYSKVMNIKKFFADHTPRATIKTNLKSAYIALLEAGKERIRQAVIGELETDPKHYALRQAIFNADFLLFLERYSDTNKWINAFDIKEHLPEKLVKYFDKEELELYRLNIVAAQNRTKTPALSWTATYETAKFIDEYQGFNYTINAIAIALEAGLRISEIRELKRDCLRPVLDEEIEAVKRHFQRQNKIAFKLDYSKSAWLVYDVVKRKKGTPEEGAPILVGKRVIDAIQRVLDYTEEMARVSGSDMLFLNYTKVNHTGVYEKEAIAVRSYSSFKFDLYALWEEGLPIARFHQYRATFATILVHLDVPLNVISKYLNHITTDVVSGYGQYEQNEFNAEISHILKAKQAKDASKGMIELQNEMKYLVSTDGWDVLTETSRTRLLERLKKHFGVKLKMTDMGACVLGEGESCQHGFELTLPCHQAGCDKFSPDTDEIALDYFQSLLANNIERQAFLQEELIKHPNIEVNFDIMKIAEASIQGIISTIEEAQGVA